MLWLSLFEAVQNRGTILLILLVQGNNASRNIDVEVKFEVFAALVLIVVEDLKLHLFRLQLPRIATQRKRCHLRAFPELRFSPRRLVKRFECTE